MDAISGLFGGSSGGSSGYASPNMSQYENAERSGIFNRLGATQTGTDANGQPIYDTTQVGQQVTPEQAQAQYSGFGNLQNAMNQTQTSTYNPTAYQKTNFNFQNLPGQVYDQAIQAGSTDINRAGANNLAAQNQAVGTRRPGLLMKGAEQNTRDVGEQLAGLQTNLRGQQAQQQVATGQAQQQAQAAENQAASNIGEKQAEYGSGENLQRQQMNAGLANNYLQSQMGAANQVQGYQDKALDYLNQLYGTAGSLTNQSAGLQNQIRGQDTGLFGNMLSAAGKVGAAALMAG